MQIQTFLDHVCYQEAIPARSAHETAEQTEAIQILLHSKFTVSKNILRTMADVCEAFCFFCVFSGP